MVNVVGIFLSRGGVDIRATDGIAIRAAQADYVLIKVSSACGSLFVSSS